MGETIFSKIIRKEIPAAIVYETDTVLAFKDINPQAPVHVLIIPKREIDRIHTIDPAAESSLLADLFTAARKIATDFGISEKGYRLVINNGDDGGQEVQHLHMHLLGGRRMTWPPG